jgi:excisionase family DNA binding protein
MDTEQHVRTPVGNVAELQRSSEQRPPSILHTLTSASRRIGCSRTTTHKLVDDGLLGYVRIGRDRRVPESEILAFIERNVVRAQR